MRTLQNFRNSHLGQRIFIIGKGPSLKSFAPFSRFRNETCIGINNVYRYFPFCQHVVLWHAELYESDQEYLSKQSDFHLFYSSFHRLPQNLPNAIDVEFSGDFPLDGTNFGTLQYWKMHPLEAMFKTTFATGIKIAWWMGAHHITLLGCDFSLEAGRTANDDLLFVETPLRNFTNEEILFRQSLVFTNLQKELGADGVRVDRAFHPNEL